jgi:hypothetical protein
MDESTPLDETTGGGSDGEPVVVRVSAPPGTGLLLLRGVIDDGSARELQEALQTLIDDGVVTVILDVSEMESISAASRMVIASASATLADRSGALLAWAAKGGPDEPIYVMHELGAVALPGTFHTEEGS